MSRLRIQPLWQVKMSFMELPKENSCYWRIICWRFQFLAADQFQAVCINHLHLAPCKLFLIFLSDSGPIIAYTCQLLAGCLTQDLVENIFNWPLQTGILNMQNLQNMRNMQAQCSPVQSTTGQYSPVQLSTAQYSQVAAQYIPVQPIILVNPIKPSTFWTF